MRFELIGTDYDLNIFVNLPAMPSRGMSLILTDSAGDEILYAKVKEVSCHASVDSEMGSDSSHSDLYLTVKVKKIDEDAIDDLRKTQQNRRWTDNFLLRFDQEKVIKRFSALLAPSTDARFQLEFSMQNDIVGIHIVNRLSEMNPGFTIGEFCKHHQDEMLSAILQTGEEIQSYRLSCEDLEFQPQDARKFVKALADHRGVFIGAQN